MMSWDQETNQRIEIVIFGVAIILTVAAGKDAYDKWQASKTEDDSELQDKLKRAMATMEPKRKLQRIPAQDDQADDIARSTSTKKLVSFGETESDLTRVTT